MITIVNADDFGYSFSVNKAICEAFKRNLISQATIMVNMPAFDEAEEIAKVERLTDKIGLHLNLTEGIPLTEKIKHNKHFVNSNGTFNSALITTQKFRFFISRNDRLCIREEVDAQIKKYIYSGFTSMHIDSHHHIHNSISLIFLIKKIAKKNGFKSMRICRNILHNEESTLKIIYKNILNFIINNSFKTVRYFGEYYSYQNYYKGKGNVEIMVHPDFINDEIVDVLKKGEKWGDINKYSYHNGAILATYKN